MMEEIWDDIPGFDGIYRASTLGRIRSIKIWKNGRFYGGGIVHPFRLKNGYYAINILYGGRKQYLIHRLIALTFIPSNGKPQVNHKDCNKANNKASNLEWMTAKENIIHSIENGLNGKVIFNHQTGVFYLSVIEAAKTIGITKHQFYIRMRGKVFNNTPFVYA